MCFLSSVVSFSSVAASLSHDDETAETETDKQQKNEKEEGGTVMAPLSMEKTTEETPAAVTTMEEDTKDTTEALDKDGMIIVNVNKESQRQ